MKNLRIMKIIRGDHNFEIGHVGEFDDVFARQLIAAGGAVEIVEAPEPEAAVVHPPENAMKKAAPTARRQKF